MGFICSAIGVTVVLALSYLGLKTLVANIAQTTVDTVVSMFTAPIRGR